MATLMGTLRYIVAALVLPGLSLQITAGDGLVKVWDLDLSRWNRTTVPNADRFPVNALSFSPDGNRIALTGTELKKDDGKIASLLLVARVGASGEDVKSFEAVQGGDFVEWSPSGDAIVVNGLIIRLASGATCGSPDTSRFISEDNLIAIKPIGPSFTSYRLTIYDKSCSPGKTWDPGRWNIVDVSIERHLLLVNKHFEENLLVDPDDGHIVRRWSEGAWPVWDGPSGQFADNGKALCNELSVDDAPRGETLRCWITDTGKLIGNAPADYATGPFVTSRGSTRVVFSEVGHVKGLIRDWDTHAYKGAVVWDYSTGEKLAAWHPETQSWNELRSRPPKKMVEPSRFAISQDGRFVAEGGNGKLTVYRIERTAKSNQP
jgi:WD40 repeat protein